MPWQPRIIAVLQANTVSLSLFHSQNILIPGPVILAGEKASGLHPGFGCP